MPVARSNGHKIHYETFGDGTSRKLIGGIYTIRSLVAICASRTALSLGPSR